MLTLLLLLRFQVLLLDKLGLGSRSHSLGLGRSPSPLLLDFGFQGVRGRLTCSHEMTKMADFVVVVGLGGEDAVLRCGQVSEVVFEGHLADAAEAVALGRPGNELYYFIVTSSDFYSEISLTFL